MKKRITSSNRVTPDRWHYAILGVPIILQRDGNLAAGCPTYEC